MLGRLSRRWIPRRCQEKAGSRMETCAIWQPVTNPKEALSDRPSSSFSQVPATSSTMPAAGVGRVRPAF